MKQSRYGFCGGRVCVFALMAICLFPFFSGAQTLVLSNQYQTVAALTNTMVTMTGHSELHVTNSGNPISGCTINLNSEDAWVFLHHVLPSYTTASLMSRFRVDGAAAVLNSNVKVVQYGQGAVVIPYPSNFLPLKVFDGENFNGESLSLGPLMAYREMLRGKISSFILKRGYTATLARNSDGTGLSVNYVAADGDLRIGALPDGLNNHVGLIRIYPWHWVAKKGSCDIAPAELNAKWNYNWNITWQAANPNYEYVAIKQQPNWPGLPNPADCGYLGVNHLSGYNEPNNSVEDAYKNLSPPGSVSDAVARQPELLGTGLRLGSPAVTDGGRSWILDFVSQAEAAGYRIDYIPIHYYRSYWNNADPASAANNLYSFLKDIYDNTHKPIWLTEFNNGANWTTDADPTFAQNRDVIEAMINKMDDAPWVERYSIYSAVEEVRQVYYNTGGYTPMGQMYKDHVSPIAYQQILPGAGMDPSAAYYFENNLNDDSGGGNNALSKDYPDFVIGHNGGTALQFDGVDDHVILPDSLSDGVDFTFAAWVYWSGGSAWQRIFDFGTLDSDHYMFLTPNASGAGLRFTITTSGWGGEQRLNTSTLSPNTWTHVAVTLSGNTGRLYVNGMQVDVQTISLNPANLNAIQHFLGRSMFPVDPYFNGRMDDVIIKNQALSATQITALAAGGQHPPQSAAGSIDGGRATPGTPYSGNVAGSISDPDGGAITYSKVYGPAWLSVASNGALSGTPGTGDTGAQCFTVRGTDAAGAMAYILLQINKTLPPDYKTGPVADWDFADAGAVNNGWIPGNGDRADLDSDGAMDSDDFRVGSTDLSGNGNHLTAWTSAWMKWSSTSTLGDFSMTAGNSYPAAGTDSAYNPYLSGIDAEAITPAQWTVEAEFRPTAIGGNQTIVGRDGNYGARAALYLSTRGTALAIEYVDVAGIDHNLQVAAGLVNNTWYHVAATSDGATLKLWLDGSQIGSLDISGSADSALALGYGTWSVSRGIYNDGHTDRFSGFIDAVAISGVALTPGHFVITGTWPSGYEFYAEDYGISGEPFVGDWNSNGIPNGMEYYLGFNPTNLSSSGSFLAFTNDYLSVAYPFNPSAYGVTGIVEWTTDLTSSNWFNTGVTYATNNSPAGIVATFADALTNQFYLRLKVEN